MRAIFFVLHTWICTSALAMCRYTLTTFCTIVNFVPNFHVLIIKLVKFTFLLYPFMFGLWRFGSDMQKKKLSTSARIHTITYMYKHTTAVSIVEEGSMLNVRGSVSQKGACGKT